MEYRHLRGEILRFCIVGGAGFIVDAGGMSTLVALHLADPVLARAVSFSLAVCLTFLLNRLWTFDAICGSLANQSIRYLCVQGSGFLINFAGLCDALQLRAGTSEPAPGRHRDSGQCSSHRELHWY